jgi:hypothetical protein
MMIVVAWANHSLIESAHKPAGNMTANAKRGFNRLFLVLTLMWATFWIVVYPLHKQWEGQQKALAEYDKAKKNCDEIDMERPDYPTLDNCYKQSWENYRTTRS